MLTASLLTSLGYGPLLFGFVLDVPGGDVTAHVVLMGLLSLTVNLAVSRSRRPLGVVPCTALLLVAVTLEELSQKLIPTRTFSLVDLAASYAGILAFAGLAAWIQSRGAAA